MRNLFFLLVVVMLCGCAKPPMIEIDAARAGMEGARAANAEKFAPTHFAKAESLLQETEEELNAQALKFALFRSYIKTKELAVATQAAATAAEAEAKKATDSGNTFGAGEGRDNPFERLLSTSGSSGQAQQKLSCTCTCVPQF